MAKGSQLTQLKAALSDAGVSRKSQLKSSGKKRKRSGATVLPEGHKEKTAKKLQEIHERLNPFDVKITKLKHDVGGRKLKGITGRPGISNQAGIDKRKKTLLVEYGKKGHVGGVVDRRFGEDDSMMSPEERMLERFTREKQRASKSAMFNLEGEDELTHYGQSLSAMDDFDGAGLALDDEEDIGQIDGEVVRKAHFGGFDDEAEEDSPDMSPRKKSKAEIMSEIISKSKEYKYLRQQEKEAVDKARFQVDQDFDSIRDFILHDADTRPAAAARKDGSSFTSGSNAIPINRPSELLRDPMLPVEKGDEDYDQLVRQLAFDKRAQPKDRTKTEEELALEEKEALEMAERARLRRMMGEESESDENKDGRKGRKRKLERSGDDLDDDFMDDDQFAGLGTGLGDGAFRSQDNESVLNGEVETDIPDEDYEDEGDSDDVGSEKESNNDASDIRNDGEGDSLPLISPLSQREKNIKPLVINQDVPFTFPCPKSHGEFLSIMEDIADIHIQTVVKRIRSLHHPSLSKDNTGKLQAFLGVLFDHILYVTSPPTPQYSVVEALMPHIFSLTKNYPVVSAEVCIAKLTLMHKNLVRGLSQGVTSSTSRTWPGSAELGFLRVVGVLWSTSDMNHAVVSAARILMGAYLGLARIRSAMDIASGMFLCTLFLQFEDLSKRLVPEAITFLLNVILHIAPHSISDISSVPGSFFLPDFNNEALANLKLTSKSVKGLRPTKPELPILLAGGNAGEPQVLLNLLVTSFRLLNKFGDLHKGLDGFIELYSPVLDITNSLSLQAFPDELMRQWSSVQDTLSKLLKFAKQSRRPLFLQAHKPIPIPSYIPKFNSNSSNYFRSQDPDRERGAAAKLRNQVKQERKGAMRELRKDARFLASVQLQKEVEESQGYNKRMKKVFTSIEEERAEQRVMEREKAREQKRTSQK